MLIFKFYIDTFNRLIAALTLSVTSSPTYWFTTPCQQKGRKTNTVTTSPLSAAKRSPNAKHIEMVTSQLHCITSVTCSSQGRHTGQQDFCNYL